VKDVKIIAAIGSGRRLHGDVSMTCGHFSVSIVKPLEHLVNRLHESVRSEVRFGRRLSDLLLDVVPGSYEPEQPSWDGDRSQNRPGTWQHILSE